MVIHPLICIYTCLLCCRSSREYYDGVDAFVNFAFRNCPADGVIKCPCTKCTCLFKRNKDTVREHLYLDGVIKDKDFWQFHGEGDTSHKALNTRDGHAFASSDGAIHEMLLDAFGLPRTPKEDGASNNVMCPTDDRSSRFFRLIQDAEQPLYPGCKKFNKLSFIVRLFNIKCLGHWTGKSFDMLLKLLKEALPEGETLPSSWYETKKIIGEFGYKYKKIDACPNDCVLFWKAKANLDECPKCGASRWKISKNCKKNGENKKVAKKVLRHFPLIPRLQRMYMCSRVAESMRWHEEDRKEDGILRHPADSPCWKAMDAIDDFGTESRNVRLGLASDGFNPFSNMSVSHSTWPVLVVPYNLPPWQCMKSPNIILSLLICGPKGPGNDIDVYLQPLIEELQILWHGVDTFDASKGEMFSMRAALLWTINDFPAYAYMSGWSTKGRLACPACNKDTHSRWLEASGKHCYTGHRRWLKKDHKFRFMSHRFDGNEELGDKPSTLSGAEVLEQLRDLSFKVGKCRIQVKGKRKRKKVVPKDPSKYLNWKKRSIFFKLPYWKLLLMRHNLDVMHIEKNVGESVLGTLLRIEGKNKDGLKSRQDLQMLGIRPSLHPQETGTKKTMLPPAKFTLSKKEKDMIFNVLKNVKVPDGYSSNIARRFNSSDNKVWGLKSHDYHVLMQQLLPIALRGISQREVSDALTDLCHFFLDLCSKTSSSDHFYNLGQQIVGVLCRLEMIFPPSFFDIMIHLIIHLADETRLAGPVNYRWMYPIER